MAVFRNPEIIAMVKERFPNFDFKKERHFRELQSICALCSTGNALQRKLDEIKKRKLEIGILVSAGNSTGIVKKISKSGHLIIEGLKGAFHPLSVERIE